MFPIASNDRKPPR
jgi:hypothetical protein